LEKIVLSLLIFGTLSLQNCKIAVFAKKIHIFCQTQVVQSDTYSNDLKNRLWQFRRYLGDTYPMWELVVALKTKTPRSTTRKRHGVHVAADGGGIRAI
jgi:hypothetical protein